MEDVKLVLFGRRKRVSNGNHFEEEEEEGFYSDEL